MLPLSTTSRICKVCHIDKPLEQLSKDNKNRIGRKNICKICANNLNKKYRPISTRIKKEPKHPKQYEPPKHTPIIGEKWKSMIGFAGKYLISDHGRVFGFAKNNTLNPRDRKGYKQIKVIVNGKNKKIMIHRLVGLHFIHNPGNKPQINHIDGNKSNNHHSNLEWCTGKENIEHAVKTGLFMSEKRKQYTDSKKGQPIHHMNSNGKNILTGRDNGKSKPVFVFDLNKNFIRSYESQNLAGKDLGIKQSKIHRAINMGYRSSKYYFAYTRDKFDTQIKLFT